MKKTLTLLTLCAAAVLGASSASAQNLKVGIVDMNKAFVGYNQSKKAQEMIDAEGKKLEADRNARIQKFKTLKDEYDKLDADTKKPELSADKKEAAVKLRDEKMNEMRVMDREVAEFTQQSARAIQEKIVRIRSGLLEEIRKVVNERAKAEGYDLVLDSSAAVLVSSPSMDFTDSVISELNKKSAQ